MHGQALLKLTDLCSLKTLGKLLLWSAQSWLMHFGETWDIFISGLTNIMVPKNSQNPGEKGEGARAARTKKSNGEMAPGTRRPIPTLWKMSGKQSTGTSREATSNAPPSSSPGGNKTQPMIMGFWKGGAQEDNLVHIMPSQAEMQITPSGKLGADSEGKMLPEDVSKEKDFLLNWLQDPEVLDAPEIVVPKEGKDSARSRIQKCIHSPREMLN
ncbi:hypothetical protein NDU88_008037 [Pleurodeles waltl]|uniref:Uncharacterized protein n=1 Tax=Pleurodeles waltl TaxID=8319 RepID=A0AAV7QRP6_PLEWA|nr:hypothetical protein NDU88_008037 [Pleurodeles waltl]